MLQTMPNNLTPTAQPHLWMSPQRMWQYHIARAVGGLLVGSIFLGWLIIQWSNPVMRLLTLLLMGMTVWITMKAILSDLHRSRDRQVALQDRVLSVTQPSGTVHVPLDQVAQAVWRDEPAEQLGLWMMDRQGQVLVHLDWHFLDDQAEARAFLQWIRKFEKLPFTVQWPPTP